MEITCKKCNTRLTISNTSSLIVKCGNCGYPNPVVVNPNAPPPSPVAPPAAVLPPPRQNNAAPITNPRPVVNPTQVNTQIPVSPTNVPGGNEVGWLVVHDENAPLQTYPLKIGRQIIGRHNNASPCDIMIITQDVFMSRNHCILEVKPVRSGGYDYLVSDRKMSSGVPENMSTNGTYVNAFQKGLLPNDVVYLNDGDTIQLGQTKMVVKTIRTVASADDATRLVKDSEYSPTVIIKH
ncbi:FHA domain-containing protein [Dyadobacter sp. CY343]|uniref:FHA domain-containing protein n=1 Tax=Dyadobacter sp. CY343 TaxID=2907299 RepID=UPI001F32C2DB|nr:FHA domain-containing protein [Dyadobacter sp. CY343]MCE7059231.1 FHA domain-containing protein [Dyadobacter sp. CY343]